MARGMKAEVVAVYAVDPPSYVYQGYAPLPAFDGNYAVIGSWIIGDEPGGMGIREDVNPVTTNLSRFVPHYLV